MPVKQHTRRTGSKCAPRRLPQQLLHRVCTLSEEDLWDIYCDDVDLQSRLRILEKH